MKKLKKLFVKANKQMLLVNVALIILGILFMIFPENSIRTICYVAGAFLCVWGVYKLVVYFKDGIRDITSFGLAGGIGLIACGLLLFFRPDFVSNVSTVIFGLILLISGIIKIQQTVNVKVAKGKGWWMLLTVAIITLVAGLFALFFPFETKKILFIYIGVSLVVDGVLGMFGDLYYTSRLPDDYEIDESKVIDV